MNNRIKLSIIIVNFNTYQFLDKCLKSISESKIPGNNFEVIVVDNASNDNSPALIKKNYSQIILITNKKNAGFAAANNQGIKIANGDYILLLNPDTLIEKKTISEMINFLEKNPKVGVTTCKVKLTTGELDDACHRGFPTPWNALCQFSGLSGLFPTSKLLNGYHLGFRDLDKTHEIDACTGAFMMVRRQAGESVNWLDEDYFWYGEDLDLCYRIKQAGWKIMFVTNSSITHFKGVASGIKKHSQDISTADEKTRQLVTKARFEVMRIFYKKHYKDKYPGWLTWLVLSGIKIKEWINLLKY